MTGKVDNFGKIGEIRKKSNGTAHPTIDVELGNLGRFASVRLQEEI